MSGKSNLGEHKHEHAADHEHEHAADPGHERATEHVKKSQDFSMSQDSNLTAPAAGKLSTSAPFISCSSISSGASFSACVPMMSTSAPAASGSSPSPSISGPAAGTAAGAGKSSANSSESSKSTYGTGSSEKKKPGDGHSHSHGHAHGNREQSKSRMIGALIMLSLFMVVEAVTGFTAGSLALLADAGHMLGDVAGISLALLAIWFASKPATPDKTYGYYRSEILAGFINSLALVGISIFITYEAYQRFWHPPVIMATPTLIVATLGLIINIASLKLLSPSADSSINARAAYLEILSDSLASVGVIISSLLIMFFHMYFADALISGLIALAILPRTWSLLKECMNILMEGTPGHIDLSALRTAMIGISGVVDVHDIHVWTITSGMDAMSGHVTIDDRSPAADVLGELTRVAKDQFGIHHTTIQVEQVHCEKNPGACAE